MNNTSLLPCCSLKMILIGYCLLFHNSICSQDLVLFNQEEVDSFDPSTTQLEGNLTIGGFGSDIVDLSNLSNLQSISGELYIEANNALVSLDKLSNLKEIGLGLYILDNYSLENTMGLENLDSFGDFMFVKNNTNLIDFSSISIPAFVHEIQVVGNHSLKNVDNLSSLLSVGNLFIENNTELENLNGLVGLEEITWNMIIAGNPKIESVDSLPNLTSGEFVLIIAGNDNLKNVNGFRNIQDPLVQLHVTNNPLLTDCCGIQHLLSDPSTSTWIVGNPSSCSSEEEVLDFQCTSSIDNKVTGELKLYPNPTRTSLYIQDQLQSSTIRIIDLYGRVIQTLPYSEHIDISDLDKGTYNLQVINTVDGVKSEKLVKI